MKEALGEDWNKNDVEMGQTFNKENAAKPLRDTFMLVLNSEVLNAESMGKFYKVRNLQINVSLSVVKMYVTP